MFLDRTLSIAFLISLLLHVAIIFFPINLKPRPLKSPLSSPNITYLRLKKVLAKKNATRQKQPKIKMKKDTVTEVKLTKDSRPKKERRKKQITANKLEPKKRNVKIPPELPEEEAPLYLDYFQSIREKIRKFVINNYPRHIACGEVCLYFVLSADGRLKELKVVEERSSQNRLLKEIARRSLQQASPFSAFPRGLNQPQLSFNVIISFELGD